MEFSKNLKQLRTDKRLTQKQLANALGISLMAVNSYERGVRIPNIDLLVRFADFFNVSCDKLLGHYAERQNFNPVNRAKDFWEKAGCTVTIANDNCVNLFLNVLDSQPTLIEGKISFENSIKGISFKNISDFCLFTNSIQQQFFDETLSVRKKICAEAINDGFNFVQSFTQQRS